MPRTFHIILFFVFLFAGELSLFAQDTLNFKLVNDKTYELYLAKDWKPLIKLGKAAIKNNIDYYYLRMRMGIAFYERNKYIKAIRQFKKAVAFNPDDTLALEYLYYAYLFSGQVENSRVLAAKFPEKLKTKVDAKNHLLNSVYLEGGYSGNANTKEMLDIRFPKPPVPPSRKDIFDHYYYGGLFIENLIGPRVRFYWGYTYYSITCLTQILDVRPPKITNVYITSRQNQLYASASLNVLKGCDITGAVHYLNLKTPIKVNGKDSVDAMTSYTPFLSVSKNISIVKVGLSASLSQLNYAKQLQIGFRHVLYLSGNRNLYYTSEYILLSERGKNSGGNPSHFIINKIVGLRVYKNCWLEASYLRGDIRNYVEENATVIYNNVDFIKQRIGATLIVSPKNNRFRFFIKYYNFKFETGNLITANVPEAINYDYKNLPINYYCNSIIGGITWNF